MTTLALYSNKGGVGKTAAAVNLAYLAAEDGYHTLLVDLDPQSAATFYFRVKPKLKRQARGFAGGKTLESSIKATDYENLDLLPADFDLRNLDLAFAERKHSRRRLELALRRFQKEFDLIILDCPPTINILAENIFNTADQLIVPIIPTTLSIRTYEQLLAYIGQKRRGPQRILAFFSMVDARRNLHRQVMADFSSQYDGVLNTVIPYLSQIEQMGIHREPVPAHSPHSHAALVFRQLWAEVQGRITTGQ
jgi:cellulose biosynthesis protein BcsQ